MARTISKIIGLMAVDPRGLIGKDNKLPWHYPEELAFFQRTIYGQVVVMGRKTFDAMPLRLLQSCTPIVFSRHHPLETQAEYCGVSCLEEFFALQALLQDQQMLMIGGAEIAHLFFQHHLMTEFLLTKIHAVYTGDVYLNLDYLQGWHEQILQQHPHYTISRLSLHLSEQTYPPLST